MRDILHKVSSQNRVIATIFHQCRLMLIVISLSTVSVHLTMKCIVSYELVNKVPLLGNINGKLPAHMKAFSIPGREEGPKPE